MSIFFNSYIARSVEYKSIGFNKDTNIEQFEINGEVYEADYNNDPEYISDGVLDISFYYLTLDGETTNYYLAFNKKEDVPSYPEEWEQEYDIDSIHVLEIK